MAPDKIYNIGKDLAPRIRSSYIVQHTINGGSQTISTVVHIQTVEHNRTGVCHDMFIAPQYSNTIITLENVF